MESEVNNGKNEESSILDTHIGKNSLFKKACSHYGAKCMLGGHITGQDVLTVHHIIRVTRNGENTLRNAALLVDSKHQVFNQLEHFASDLSMDVNAFLYEYHGKCHDDIITTRIDRIMTFAEDTVGLKGALTQVRRDETLLELFKLKKSTDEEKVDYSVIPDLYDTLNSMHRYFPDLYGEVRSYLSICESVEGDVSILKRIRKILGLVEWKKEIDLENRALCKESILSLESTKDIIRARTKSLNGSV